MGGKTRGVTPEHVVMVTRRPRSHGRLAPASRRVIAYQSSRLRCTISPRLCTHSVRARDAQRGWLRCSTGCLLKKSQTLQTSPTTPLPQVSALLTKPSDVAYAATSTTPPSPSAVVTPSARRCVSARLFPRRDVQTLNLSTVHTFRTARTAPMSYMPQVSLRSAYTQECGSRERSTGLEGGQVSPNLS